VRVDDSSTITAAVERLRTAPPFTLGGLPVTLAEDLAVGVEGLPPTDGLRYRLDGSAHHVGACRVIVRPSGTEPKLKSYLEVVVPVGSATDGMASARTAADAQLDSIGAELTALLGL
jgi:phosphomannomutase